MRNSFKKMSLFLVVISFFVMVSCSETNSPLSVNSSESLSSSLASSSDAMSSSSSLESSSSIENSSTSNPSSSSEQLSSTTQSSSSSDQLSSTTQSSSSMELSSSSAMPSSSSIAVCINSSTSTGFIDCRDGKEYLTTVIGVKKWMSENLKFETQTGSMCPENDVLKCESIGRWYTWETASWVCPFGWHLPSQDEWGAILTDLSITYMTAGTVLKSTTGWGLNPGNNSSGFNAKVTGYNTGSANFALTSSGNWWTATIGSTANTALNRYLTSTDQRLLSATVSKNYLIPVRCVED